MNLLYVNDETNNYPKNSWYTATSEILPEFESLNNETGLPDLTQNMKKVR